MGTRVYNAGALMHHAASIGLTGSPNDGPDVQTARTVLTDKNKSKRSCSRGTVLVYLKISLSIFIAHRTTNKPTGTFDQYGEQEQKTPTPTENCKNILRSTFLGHETGTFAPYGNKKLPSFHAMKQDTTLTSSEKRYPV